MRSRSLVLALAIVLLGCEAVVSERGRGIQDASEEVLVGGEDAGQADAAVTFVDAGSTVIDAGHTVGECNALAPIDQWEPVSPPINLTLHTAVVAVMVDPQNAGTLYVGTERQGLWKSTQCGAAGSWVKVNTGRNGSVLDTGAQWSMAIDPSDSKVLYVANGYGSNVSLFKSINGGVDWDSMFPPGSEVEKTVEYNFTQEVSMDPTDPRHLVVSFHANCRPPAPAGCMADTRDSGATWRIFKSPAGGWIEDARPIVLGPSTYLYATSLGGLFYTADSGGTWEKVANGGGHQVYRASSGTYYSGSANGTMRSPDGHTWTKIDKSPNGDAIIGDGSRLFTSWTPCCGQPVQPFFTASQSNDAVWKSYPSPIISQKAKYFAYDNDHHLLYASTNNNGLWRVVTK
jgi:hypothetical protein